MDDFKASRSAAIEHLQAEKQSNPSKPPKIPRGLPLSALHVEPAAFQVRAEGLSPERVEEIAKGLDGSTLDEPVHVWWSGERWIVIEGHHRYAAYVQKFEDDGVTLKIPVVAHPDISLGEALGLAGRLNYREKAKISKAEMLDGAWRMVCMGEGSISQQSIRSGVAKGTIDNMRAVKRKLEGRRVPNARMLDHGWKQSREWANGKTQRDHSPDALEAMAQEMAEELKKLKVTTAIKSPDVLARALVILSPELPERLLESEPFWTPLDITGRALLKEADEERKLQSNPYEVELLQF